MDTPWNQEVLARLQARKALRAAFRNHLDKEAPIFGAALVVAHAEVGQARQAGCFTDDLVRVWYQALTDHIAALPEPLTDKELAAFWEESRPLATQWDGGQ